MRGIATIVCVLLAATYVAALCKCGDKGADIGPCHVNFHACGCLKHLTKWEYECTVKDKETGTSDSARWYKSDKGACENAVVPLFQNHNTTNCNCQTSPVPVGKCTIEMKACWFFQNTAQMSSKTPVLKFFARDPQTGVTGYSCCFQQNQVEAGGQAAVQSLGRLESLTKCFTAEQPEPVTNEEWAALFATPAVARSFQSSLPLMP